MKIAVCVKLAPDPEDIQVLRDGSISLDRAEWIIGGFDLPAIEAAVRLADASNGSVTAISAGPRQVDQSRLKKDILSRGAQELFMVADDALADAGTHLTASVLAAVVRKAGPFDLVLCGEGSPDLYFQQTGIQIGEILEWPVLNYISKVELEDGHLVVERSLEEEIEVLEVPLPCVLSVTSDIHIPRLPTMKDILKAGQKPVKVETLQELGASLPSEKHFDILEIHAPQQVQRKQIRIDGSPEQAVQTLIEALKKEKLIS